MMSRLYTISVISVLLSLIMGCTPNKDISIKPTEIIAVYMHNVGVYSVAISGGQNSITITKVTKYAGITVKLIADVNVDESMWYSCRGILFPGGVSDDASCEIHIRSIDDIKGAGWNNGKFGSGSTERIN